MTSEAILKSIMSNADAKRGKWSESEDELLRAAVEYYGEKHWKLIAQHVSGRSPIQCLHRWSKILKPGLIKGPWTVQEDQKLKDWVINHGTSKWAVCAIHIPGRSGKQCRERWYNTLCPEVKKGGWLPSEDKIIFDLYHELGSQWTIIAKQLPGRTENSIKNRFYCTLRKYSNKAKEPEPEIQLTTAEPQMEDMSSISKGNTKEEKMMSLLDHVRQLESMLTTTRNELLSLENNYDVETKPALSEDIF